MPTTDSDAVESRGPTNDVPRDLTSFQRNILIVLAEDPKYGLAIKRELEAYYGDEVNHGRLYPNLDDLVEMGLIEKSALDKRTNQYELTETGHETVRDQLEWTLARTLGSEDTHETFDAVLEEYC